MKKIIAVFILIFICFEIYSAESLVRKNSAEKWHTADLKLNDSSVKYQNVSPKALNIFSSKFNSQHAGILYIFGVPSVKDTYVMLVHLRDKPLDEDNHSLWFVNIVNNKFVIFYESFPFDGCFFELTNITLFVGQKSTLVAVQSKQPAEPLHNAPLVFEIKDKKVTKMAEIPYRSTCKTRDCKGADIEVPLFINADTRYDNNSYYFSFYSTLLGSSNVPDIVLDVQKKNLVFKLTPQKFERVPELEK